MKKKKFGKRKSQFSIFLQWMTPGLGVKRWVLLILFGTILLGIGIAIFVLDVYRNAPDTWWLPLLSILSLRVLPRILRVVIFAGVGIAVFLYGIWGLSKAVLKPFVKPGSAVVDTLTRYRRRERGPKVVVVGGGHGLSNLLRGFKEFTNNLTAVVSVADDGGSSGRLRESLGIPPPGDIRNCLAALSDDEELMTQLFQYRFAQGNGGLEGHSFGNLFISAITDIVGSFEDAVAESGRFLAVNGRVLPASIHDVRLVADILPKYSSHEVRIKGESQIPTTNGRIKRVWLEPNDPPAYPRAVNAILNADLIVVGPGSLFTSVLATLLVPDILNALRAASGLKIYVCNVATQPGETDDFTCKDHLESIAHHCGDDLFDLVVCNNKYDGDLLDGMEWVFTKEEELNNYNVYQGDLVDPDEAWHHSSKKLASVLMDILQERTGPLLE